MTRETSGSPRKLRRRSIVTLVCSALAACAALGTAAFTATGDAGSTPPPSTPPAQPVDFVGPHSPTEAFGLDLLGAQPPGNVVVSPDSVATALAMAGTGAKGRTAEQIAATLGLKGPAAFDSVGNLQRKLVGAQAAEAAGHPDAPT